VSMDLQIINARLVTPTSPAKIGSPWPARAARGAQMGTLRIIDRATIRIRDGRIVDIAQAAARSRDGADDNVGPGDAPSMLPPSPGQPSPAPHALAPHSPPGPTTPRTIDAAGRAVVPGFVDCHTHALWAGSRLDEWDLKRSGATYQQIMAAGGGIMSTVRAVRSASPEQLTANVRANLDRMLAAGSTSIEVKGGYGLDLATELKILRAIRAAAEGFAGTVVPTALLGHAIDDADPNFVDRTIRQTLPAIAAEFPGIAVDAFIEKGAWSVEQACELFERAAALGLPIRMHTDQFTSLGMIGRAVSMGARSCDHLEAASDADLALLASSPASSPCAGVMLPACGFHLDGRYARGRRFVDAGGGAGAGGAGGAAQAGGLLAIASNYNPGSAPCGSMAMIQALAVRHLGLSPAEALTAATLNPAAILNLPDRGTIEPGARADLLILHAADERMISWEAGLSPVAMVIAGGRPVPSLG